MKSDNCWQIFARMRDASPAPTTELNYTSPFELLISVMLSAQTTDLSVNKATYDLYLVANTPEKIIDLGIDGLVSHIKSVGLYRTKARNIIATCGLLVRLHGGQIPDSREQLEMLPGVGRKTANVILNIAFGIPTIAVDTHVFRVSNRTGIAPGEKVRAVEEKLMKIVPNEFLQHAHHWLILHGRYTCTARKPLCLKCVINDLCEKRQLRA